VEVRRGDRRCDCAIGAPIGCDECAAPQAAIRQLTRSPYPAGSADDAANFWRQRPLNIEVATGQGGPETLACGLRFGDGQAAALASARPVTWASSDLMTWQQSRATFAPSPPYVRRAGFRPSPVSSTQVLSDPQSPSLALAHFPEVARHTGSKLPSPQAPAKKGYR